MMHLKWFALGWLSLAAILAGSSPARATMYITGNGGLNDTDPQRYNRFYSGSDKEFIGQAYDWSGVGGGSPWATMISPSFFISATHDHPGASSSVTFYSGNSTSDPSYTGIVGGGSQIGNSDVWLSWLTQPIPSSANIAKYPILVLPNDSAYVGKTIYTYGAPNLVGRNVISSVQTYSEAGETMSGMFFNYDLPGVGADESYLMGGDSGAPSFAVVNGQLALLGEHFSNWGTCGQPEAPGNVAPEINNGSLINGDPNTSNPAGEVGQWWSIDGFASDYVSAINAQMTAAAACGGVGVGEQVTPVVPEPSTLILLAAAAIGLSGYVLHNRDWVGR
jgi:hypothetical protein